MAAFIGRVRSRWPVRFAEEFVSRWQEHRVGGLAAEIAFWGLLSLLPLMLVLTAGLGWLADQTGEGTSADIEEWVVEQAVNIFGDSSDVVDLFSGLFQSTSSDALTVGVIAALYTASRGFATAVRAIDVAYDIDQRRGWVGARLIGLVLAFSAVLVGVVVVSLLVVGPLIGGADELADEIGLGSTFASLWRWLRWPVALVVLVSWAASMYH
ncbi:MAG: hypothetical protein HKN26_14660, partial [Acidimicrobiales bacterium]|nr:hypothetical protein [Acidimicrobiales bacterium]